MNFLSPSHLPCHLLPVCKARNKGAQTWWEKLELKPGASSDALLWFVYWCVLTLFWKVLSVPEPSQCTEKKLHSFFQLLSVTSYEERLRNAFGKIPSVGSSRSPYKLHKSPPHWIVRDLIKRFQTTPACLFSISTQPYCLMSLRLIFINLIYPDTRALWGCLHFIIKMCHSEKSNSCVISVGEEGPNQDRWCVEEKNW